METGILLWCNHVATYWGTVALQRRLVESDQQRAALTPELVKRVLLAQTQAVLPVILVASIFLRRDPLPAYASIPLFLVLVDILFYGAHWALHRYVFWAHRRHHAWVHTIGACALDASWVENVFCNALPLGAAVILSGAAVRAAHVMTFVATFNTVAVHSGRVSPHSEHHAVNLGAGGFVDWAVGTRGGGRRRRTL